MSRPPHAREAVLDAYEQMLIDEGAGAATMDAVARLAGVSKGGLLYHYPSKTDLENALYARLDALAAADVEHMQNHPDGPIAAYIRSSASSGDAVDRAIVATARLAQEGRDDAVVALRRVRESWSRTVRPHVRDDVARDLVMLLGDGLYYNNALGAGMATSAPSGAALDTLVSLVERVVRS